MQRLALQCQPKTAGHLPARWRKPNLLLQGLVVWTHGASPLIPWPRQEQMLLLHFWSQGQIFKTCSQFKYKVLKKKLKKCSKSIFLSVTIDLTQLIYACKESIPLLAYFSLLFHRKNSWKYLWQLLNSVKIVKFVEKIGSGSVESLRPSPTRLCLSTPPKDSHQESLSRKEGSIAKSDR